MIGQYRQKIIEELIAKESGRCTYCQVDVRRNWLEFEKHDHDATVDHVIPKAKGGKNTMANYALACRRCNHAKGDRTVEEFLADPRSLSERQRAERKAAHVRGVKSVPVPETVARGFRFLMPLPRGATLPKESLPVPVYEHSSYQPPRKLTGVELARAVAAIIDPPKRKKRRRAKYIPPPPVYVLRGGFMVEK